MGSGDSIAAAVQGLAQSDTERDLAIGVQVRAEQVRTLYRQSVPVLLTNVINASILVGLLWEQASHAVLVPWLSAMALMSLVRYELSRRFWRGASAREPHAYEAWATRFTVGSLSAGLLWGFAGFALMPDSLLLQVVIVFVLAGMAAGATLTLSCVTRAYVAYLLPSLTPACVRLFSFGGSEHVAMAAMLALFVCALVMVARTSSWLA